MSTVWIYFELMEEDKQNQLSACLSNASVSTSAKKKSALQRPMLSFHLHVWAQSLMESCWFAFPMDPLRSRAKPGMGRGDVTDL